MFGLAVDDDAVALPPECAGGFPDLLHQHARGVILSDANPLPDEFFLVLVGGAESRDDHNVIASQGIPEKRRGAAGLGQPAADREWPALVRLQKTETAPPEVFVHERIVDQFTQHKHSAARVSREGFVGAFDGVFHAETKAEMTRNDVAHRTKIEHRGTAG